MTDYKTVFRPFIDLFNQGQVQTILLAWLPTKMESYLPGIMAVDMFLTTIIASGITTVFAALYLFVIRITTGNCWNKNIVKVQIEHYVSGIYGDQQTSTFYLAISWIISQQTKQLSKGSFLVQPVNSITKVDPDDDCEPPGFNILPEKNQVVSIDYKGRKFDITYSIPESDTENRENGNNGNSSNIKQMPSIYLTTMEDSNTSVDAISDFLNDVTRSYLESRKKLRVRSRYERSNAYWHKVQALSSNRDLETVALEETQESLIKKELETFTSDKDFYRKIEIDILPEKVFELTYKYQNMKPEEIAKLMEDELKRIKKVSISKDNLNDEAKEEAKESTAVARDGKDKKTIDDDNKDEEGMIEKEEIEQIDSIEMTRASSGAITWTSDDSDSNTDVEVNTNEKNVVKI
ncbi:984_t:CDS:2 [Entrophospora sp. SA101]|nr:984_t:CDS:2 [Entrophospora sp. SA101]